MKDFSRNFILLVESLRSEDIITEAGDIQDEDSRGKKNKRVERKRKRLEGNFMSNDGDEFKLRPFLKVLEILKDQILAERINVFNTAKTKSIGSKYSSTILSKLDTLLTKATSLLRYAKSEFDAENGRLEVSSDQSTIDSLISQYNAIQDGYKETAILWKESKQKELDEKPVDQDNEEIEKYILAATKLFDEAKTLLINNAATFTGSSNKEVAKNNTTTDKDPVTVKEFKLKKSETIGKVDENIKKIQSLYLEIFKGTKVEKTTIYKKAAKYQADGKWGPTTSLMIDQIKKGIKALPAFKEKDLGATNEINQNLILGLEELKKFKSGKKNESIDNQKILRTFESFMKERRLVNEEASPFDAVETAMSDFSPAEVEPKKTVIKKAETVEALAKNIPEVKAKVKPEDVEDMIEKYKKEVLKDAKNELKVEELVGDLKKIKGVRIVDGFDSSKEYKFNEKEPNKGYLAKCPGMLFFANGVCVITYGGEIGYYDAETGYYKGKTGWREKISELIKSKGVPLKYKALTKKLADAATLPSAKFAKESFVEMEKYSKSTVKTILKAAKYYLETKNMDLFNLVRDASKKYDYVKKFYTKNQEAFKELA